MKLAQDEKGQGTVEAAVVIPVLFLLLLMLLQPGIVLYDRLVMRSAAAEACRLLATGTDDYGSMQRACEAFIRHRLAAIPQHDSFHVHGGDCSWRIELAGNEHSPTVTVRIANELRPLPLFDAGAKALGAADASGTITLEEAATAPTQPSWAAAAEGGLAGSGWVGAWCE